MATNTTRAMPLIKSFQFIRSYYLTSGIYTPQSNRYCLLNGKFLLNFFLFVVLFVASIAYLLFEATTIGDQAYSYCTSIAVLWFTVLAVANTLNIPKILELIRKFDEFICKRTSNTESNLTRKYDELIVRIERMSELLYFIIGKLAVFLCFLPALLVTAINYFIYDLGNDSFYLVAPVMLPLNWKSPLGYLITFSLEYFEVTFASEIASFVLSFLFGSCFLMKLCVEDITNELSSLDIEDKTTSNGNGFQKRKIILGNAVQHHADLKQFVGEINEIYKFISTDFFMWNLLTLCCTSLIIQLELSGHVLSPMIFAVTSLEMLCTFMFVLIFCELGQMICDQFDMFNSSLGRCNWYLYPIEMQQMLIVFMANAQKPSWICGFGNILYTRDTFKKTIKASFSYFMMLRGINQ